MAQARTRPSGRPAIVALLVAAALTGALVTRDPAVVLLVIPILAGAAAELGGLRSSPPSLVVTLEPASLLEGDVVNVMVELREVEPDSTVDIAVHAGAFFRQGERSRSRTEPRDRSIGSIQKTVELVAQRWGHHQIGPVEVRIADPGGWTQTELRVDIAGVVRVLPRPEQLRRLLRPHETQIFSGNRVARAIGGGIEFAGVRPFLPGDQIREVSWRTTARRGGLWVTDRHPERNTDVVLFLDTFDDETLDEAVRLASTLATSLLRERDRVGLVLFGGVLHWLRPGMGLKQHYAVIEALLDTRVFASVARREVSVVPPHALPPNALVVAMTPLLDERAITALADLRRRAVNLAVIEVEPELHELADGVGAQGTVTQLSRRLWQQQRETVRSRLRMLGVPVARAGGGRPLELALEELRR